MIFFSEKSAAMDKIVLASKPKGPNIRPFTKDSLEKIAAKIAEEKENALKEAEERKKQEDDEKNNAVMDVNAARNRARKAAESNKPKVRQRPNQALEAGKKFPEKLGDFPPELYGKPIEDLDEFYHNKYVSKLTSHNL